MATETWLLNETLTDTTSGAGVGASVNFISNDTNYIGITVFLKVGREGLQVDYKVSATEPITVYNTLTGSGWVNEAYRTITFETAPTGDFLTWLQANGTKQEITTTATLEAGTYIWKNELSNAPDLNIEESFAFASSNKSYSRLIWLPGTVNYDNDVVYEDGWSNEAYRTIVLAADQTVSSNFYERAITQGNLVKQDAASTNFKLGSNDIDALYIGAEEVTVAYLGADQIYKKPDEPTLKTIVANSYAFDWPTSSANVSSSIAFTSNDQQFTAMIFNASTLTLTYANNVTNATVVAFTDADGWTNEAYSFVTVTTDAKVMNDFYNFFTTQTARGQIFIGSGSMDPYRVLAFTYKSASSAILATQTEINENGLRGQFELNSELINTLPAYVGLWMDENQDYLSVTNLRQITLTDASLFSLTKPLTPEVLIYNSSTSVPAINKSLTEDDDVYPLLFAKVHVKGVPANTATIKATKQSAYPKLYNAVTNAASTAYADCVIEGPYDKDKSFSVYMRCFVTKNSTASIGNVRFTCLDSSGATITSKVVAVDNISDFTTVVTCDFSVQSDEPTDEDVTI